MITITWYNVVAIVVGILFFCWINMCGNDSGPAAGIGGAFVLLLVMVFYAVWGGIFWW